MLRLAQGAIVIVAIISGVLFARWTCWLLLLIEELHFRNFHHVVSRDIIWICCEIYRSILPTLKVVYIVI